MAQYIVQYLANKVIINAKIALKKQSRAGTSKLCALLSAAVATKGLTVADIRKCYIDGSAVNLSQLT